MTSGIDYRPLSGLGRAVSCVCVCVRTVTLEVKTFDLDIWHVDSPSHCVDHVEGQADRLKFMVTGGKMLLKWSM